MALKDNGTLTVSTAEHQDLSQPFTIIIEWAQRTNIEYVCAQLRIPL